MHKIKLIFLLFTSLILGQTNQKAKQNCLISKENDVKLINKNKIEMTDKNIFGDDLKIAGTAPMTGFYRNGFCSTGIDDTGIHVVAAVMTDKFLNFSKSKGNDLITPNLNYGFPGLKSGDVWCLCANRWKDALKAGVAPPVILEATNQKSLETISLEDLKSNAVK